MCLFVLGCVQVCVGSLETRHQIPQSWSYRVLWAVWRGCWEPYSGPEQQQQALLTAEPSVRLLNPRLFMLHKQLHHQVALKGPGSGWTVHVLWLRNENYVLSYGRYYCQWSKDKMGVPRGIKAEGRGLIIAGGSSRKLSIARESASVLLWQSSQERHAEPPGRELAISLHPQGDFLLLWNQVPQWLTLWAATPSVQGQKALAAVITAWAVFAHLRGPPELSFSLGANPSPASLFPVPHH